MGDLFISHASEDKERFVRPLARALHSLGVSVWYDEFSLRPGDSLSRSIDQGIADSRFGVVVVSPAFISKPWPDYELRGLVTREIAQGARIIPVWHGVTHQDVCRFSPSLADKVAVKTEGLDALDVALQILRVVRPDIYEKHPRAELARMASGEAIAELQESLESLREQLAEFQCPTCGAPLSERKSVPQEYGDALYEYFACGYEPNGRPCPSDPEFPKFEDYELLTEEHPTETGYGRWRCFARPTTPTAQRLGPFGESGSTEEEAKQRVLERFRRVAEPWSR